MRFLILLGLFYFGYRLIKSWVHPGSIKSPPLRRADVDSKTGAIDDVMIKDPMCGVYFPKRDGVCVNEGGKELFFCSTKCKDAFLVSRGGK